MSESVDIRKYLKNKPKVCKRALILNFILLLGQIYFTIKYIMLDFSDLSASQINVTIAIGAAMILLDITSFLALRYFLTGNKLAKIYFMLLAVFGSVFAMGYQLMGVIIMVYLIVTLFINVSCYNKLYPSNS